MDYAKESLRLHGEWKGKIEVVTRVPVENKDDLSLAYTPGVAQPCLEIQKDVDKSYDLTRRWNMCLVVTDGSAVLGLGNIGPEAGMPVMEGLVFKLCPCFRRKIPGRIFPLGCIDLNALCADLGSLFYGITARHFQRFQNYSDRKFIHFPDLLLNLLRFII